MASTTSASQSAHLQHVARGRLEPLLLHAPADPPQTPSAQDLLMSARRSSKRSASGLPSLASLAAAVKAAAASTSAATAPAAAAPPLRAALTLSGVSAGLVFVYTACAYLLPDFVVFMSEATHVAALHGIVSLLVVPCCAALARLVAGPLPKSFPVTHAVAIAPQFVVGAANTLLLVFLGVESWLQLELDSTSGSRNFSVLVLVQMLAVLESGIIGVFGIYVLLRLVTYRRLQHEAAVRQQQMLQQLRRQLRTGTPYTSPFPAPRSLDRADAALLATPIATPGAASARPEGDDLLVQMQSPGFALAGGFGAGGGSGGGGLPATPYGASASPFAGAQQAARVSERVDALERSEDRLLREMRNMSTALENALAASAAVYGAVAEGNASDVGLPRSPTRAPLAAGDDGASIDSDKGGSPGARRALAPSASSPSSPSSHQQQQPHVVAGLLRAALEDVSRLTDVTRAMQARCADLEERAAYFESELRRASGDVQKLRAALKDERKRNDKLFATLDLEREANAQAQTVIGDLQTRVALAPPPQGPGSMLRESSFGPGAASRGAMGDSRLGALPTLARSSSRMSFAGSLSTPAKALAPQ